MNEVDLMIDVNLKGTIYWTREVLPDLLADGGDIVRIASLGGVRSFPGWTLYCAAKHGVVGFAGALAQEVADRNVRVTTICPGANCHRPLGEAGDVLLRPGGGDAGAPARRRNRPAHTGDSAPRPVQRRPDPPSR